MIICRRCGHANEASETFCVSCGTFLKWDGESVAGAGDETGVIDDRPLLDNQEPAQPAPDPSAPVVCRVCATRNTPERTFCRSCGERLVPEPVEPVIASDPVRAGWGGIGPLVAGGLVIAVLVVLALVVLRPFGQTPRAASPPESDPPKTAETDVPTSLLTEAPEPTELEILDVRASSFPDGPSREPDRYAPKQAVDGSLDTSWQEGESEESGQWIEVDVAAARFDRVVIFNGWQWKDDAFYANLRLRDIQILVDGAEVATATLEDAFGDQSVGIEGASGTTVRVVIVSTYDSEARPNFSKNSPFDDAAVSEIQLFGIALP